ncbi:MAG: O-antigen ligase family protein [Saprospiraceae bacterium]
MTKDSEYYRSRIFWLGHVVFMIGLVSSKALISFGTGILILSTIPLFIASPKKLLAPPPQVLGFFMLFILPFISGLWSSNGQAWVDSVLNKILLPALACAYWLAPGITRKVFTRLNLFQFGLVLLISIYSIISFFYTPDITAGYLRAKTLKVLLSDDHVHFSLLVVLTLILMIKEIPRFKQEFNRTLIFIIYGLMFWLFLYLHILGAKTGLLLSYFGILIWCWKRANNLIKIIALPMIFGLLFTAYQLIPTFKNRFHYTLYDFNQYVHGSIVNGLTDGARVLSWKAGIDVAIQHPLIGVGFGDLEDTFMKWHEIHSAHLERYNWLQPSNEWLTYLCGCGIPGAIFLSLGLWWIFSKSPSKKDLFFVILFILQVMMMWYEVPLSSQTGITLFVFSICWYQFPQEKLISEINQ